MNTTTIEQIARATVRANTIREASYIHGTFRYHLDHHEAAEKAMEAEGITDPRARALIDFLHLSGEGIDVARAMLAMKP
jgi:hypothetical protein